MANIQEFNAEMQSLASRLASMKQEFEAIIVDQSIPLDERWKFWCDAPVNLKNTSRWVEHFECFKLYGERLYGRSDYRFNWYSDWNIEKYETVYMQNVLENLEEQRACDERIADEEFEEYEWTDDNVINMFCEEVLQKNLHSFVFDW